MDNKIQSSLPKVERRIVEKNRRNHMKILYSRLNSLLPNQDSKDITMTLPDQIDQAINYIKHKEMKLKLANEKKERLMGKKSFEASSSSSSAGTSPQIKIQEMGNALEIVLTSGLEDQFLFNEIISVLHQEGADVANASYSVVGASVFHTVHAEIGGDSVSEFGAAKVKERLKRLVYGSTSDMEVKTQWLDFDFHPETWDF